MRLLLLLPLLPICLGYPIGPIRFLNSVLISCLVSKGIPNECFNSLNNEPSGSPIFQNIPSFKSKTLNYAGNWRYNKEHSDLTPLMQAFKIPYLMRKAASFATGIQTIEQSDTKLNVISKNSITGTTETVLNTDKVMRLEKAPNGIVTRTSYQWDENGRLSVERTCDDPAWKMTSVWDIIDGKLVRSFVLTQDGKEQKFKQVMDPVF